MALALVVAAGAAYVWLQLRQGWIPHDEGTLGQSATRLLRGELPHADFDAMYTGGLAALNALAFEIGGTRLMVPRIVLWGTLVAWAPVAYWIARRFAGPLASAAGVLLMVAWSVPNYPAAMPSWYNLFLATFGTAGLIRHLETGRRRWLFAAGLCGGVSVLFKITGVYFLAAAGLFLMALEQSESSARPDPEAPAAGPPLVYRGVTLGLCAVALAVLTWTVGRPDRVGNVVSFAVPVGALVLFLGQRETTVGPAGSPRRFRRLLGKASPLLAGAALPLLLFLVPYAATGSVDELARGLFVLPARRLDGAAATMPGPETWGPALVPVGLVALAAAVPARARWVLAAAAAAVGGWMVVHGGDREVYRAAWTSLRPLIPVVVLAGLALLSRRPADPGGAGSAVDRDGLAVFAVLAVAALCSLIQFPFGTPIYFMYAAPLLVPAFLGTVDLSRRLAPSGPVVVALLCFHLFFAARWLNTGSVGRLGLWYEPDPQTARLDLPRAKLLVPEFEKMEYEELVAEFGRHPQGDYIYAGPDSPEVYFLTGRRNPTRALFEFLSVDDPRGKELLSVLRRHGVTVVAVNRHPAFSEPLGEETLELLRRRYPRGEQIGHFLVLWR